MYINLPYTYVIYMICMNMYIDTYSHTHTYTCAHRRARISFARMRSGALCGPGLPVAGELVGPNWFVQILLTVRNLIQKPRLLFLAVLHMSLNILGLYGQGS